MELTDFIENLNLNGCGGGFELRPSGYEPDELPDCPPRAKI